jgi:hypothetical protein
VGLRAVLEAVVKRKVPVPAWTRTSDHPARSPLLYHGAIPAPQNLVMKGKNNIGTEAPTFMLVVDRRIAYTLFVGKPLEKQTRRNRWKIILTL